MFARISGTYDLDEALTDAVYLQECCPENLKIRKAVMVMLDESLVLYKIIIIIIIK